MVLDGQPFVGEEALLDRNPPGTVVGVAVALETNGAGHGCDPPLQAQAKPIGPGRVLINSRMFGGRPADVCYSLNSGANADIAVECAPGAGQVEVSELTG